MKLSQPTLEPHSLCYTCWVQVVYSRLLSLHPFVLLWVYSTAAQFPAMWRTTSAASMTSRHLSPSRRPCGALLRREFRICFITSAVSDIFVINVVINSYSFIISFYVTCVVISWWFCCIYAWLDPGAYMIARFMFFVNRVLHPLIPSPN